MNILSESNEGEKKNVNVTRALYLYCDLYLKIMRQFKQPVSFNPLPDAKILDWSKLKQITDDILKWI